MKSKNDDTSDGMIRRLSPEQLRLIGTKLFGDEIGWQVSVARAIGVSPGAITRWVKGATPIPTPASLLLQYMLQAGLPERHKNPLVPARAA